MDRLYYYKRKFNQALIIHGICWLVGFIILGIFLFPKQIEEGVIEPHEPFTISLVFLGVLTVINLLYKLLGVLSFKSESILSVAMILCFPLGVVGILVFIPIYRYYNVKEFVQEKLSPLKESLLERKILNKTISAYQSVWKKQNFLKMILLPLILLLPVVAVIGGLVYLYFFSYDIFNYVLIGFIIIFYIFVSLKLGGLQDFEVTTKKYGVSIGDTFFDYGEVYLHEYESKTKTETSLDITAFLIAIPATIILLIAFAICLVIFTVSALLRLILPFLPFGGRSTIFLKRKTFVDYEYTMGVGFLKKPFFVLNRLLYKIFRINLVSRDFWREGIGQNYIETQLKDRNLRILNKKLDRIERKYGEHY